MRGGSHRQRKELGEGRSRERAPERAENGSGSRASVCCEGEGIVWAVGVMGQIIYVDACDGPL